jgi:bifunctional non-homologous end joining protein LigD
MSDDVRANTPGEQIGSYELIEGNIKTGYLDLYLASAKYTGEWLMVSADGGSEWQIRKPTKAESGLTFELPSFNNLPLKNTPARIQLATESPAAMTLLRKQSLGTQRSKRKGSADRKERQPAAVPRNLGLEDLPKAAPVFEVPMECRMVDDVPSGAGWLYELKLDGYRAIAVIEKRVGLLSRYGRSFKERFPNILRALERIQVPDCVLDGEVVALDSKGRPNFQELQNSRSSRQPIIYYVFDILNYGGRSLKTLPLNKRREILERVAESFVDPVRLSAAVQANAAEFLTQVRRLGLEGVVAKRLDSIYESGKRPGSWIKYRVNEREEFVIGGYRRSDPTMNAILVGQFRNDKLWFVEKVKNGFVPETRQRVFEALQTLIVEKCPFANLPERDNRRGAVNAEQMKQCVWVEPVQRCEIDFVEWTRGGHLRHAAFRDLTGRTDRPSASPKHARG